MPESSLNITQRASERCKQRDRAGDQIVEIEFAARGLCGLIAGEDFADENHQSGRALETSGGLAFCSQDFKPRLFGFEVCEEIGRFSLRVFVAGDFLGAPSLVKKMSR